MKGDRWLEREGVVTTRYLAAVALAVLAIAAVQQTPRETRMQTIMRSKLANAQSMLKGIATADYREIDRSAEALSRISEAEIVSWQNPPKPEYTTQAMVFMTSVDGLREAAQRRDMSAVGTEYSALVSSCIRCHTYVRDARVALLTSHLSN